MWKSDAASNVGRVFRVLGIEDLTDGLVLPDSLDGVENPLFALQVEQAEILAPDTSMLNTPVFTFPHSSHTAMLSGFTNQS